MPTEASSLKKIKTCKLHCTFQGISASSFSNVITLANETDLPKSLFQKSHKQTNTLTQNKHPKTTVVKFIYGGIYRGRMYRSSLKHLGSLSIKYLTNNYNTSPNTNTILHLAKGAQGIFTLKLNKDHNIGTSYQSISLLSPIAEALEKALLP